MFNFYNNKVFTFWRMEQRVKDMELNPPSNRQSNRKSKKK